MGFRTSCLIRWPVQNCKPNNGRVIEAKHFILRETSYKLHERAAWSGCPMFSSTARALPTMVRAIAVKGGLPLHESGIGNEVYHGSELASSCFMISVCKLYVVRTLWFVIQKGYYKCNFTRDRNVFLCSLWSMRSYSLIRFACGKGKIFQSALRASRISDCIMASCLYWVTRHAVGESLAEQIVSKHVSSFFFPPQCPSNGHITWLCETRYATVVQQLPRSHHLHHFPVFFCTMLLPSHHLPSPPSVFFSLSPCLLCWLSTHTSLFSLNSIGSHREGPT